MALRYGPRVARPPPGCTGRVAPCPRAWKRATAAFRDAREQDGFVCRLAAPGEVGDVPFSARVLLPNHFHLLVRTGGTSSSRAVRSFLTEYAGPFTFAWLGQSDPS